MHRSRPRRAPLYAARARERLSNSNFTHAKINAGLTGDEYVYIVPDYVRFENQTDIWVDRTEGTLTSGRDVESRRSMQNIMFVRY